jgi:4-hydroxy-3-methylbut-2-en-1-yl diphosphate reductase
MSAAARTRRGGVQRAHYGPGMSADPAAAFAPEPLAPERPLLVLAPLALDRRAVRAGAPSAHVLLTGLGPRRARRAAWSASALPGSGVAVVGSCAAIDPDLAPGELVLASEVRHRGGVIDIPAAGIVAGMLRRAGIAVRVGPIVSHPHGLLRSERQRLRSTGALAADAESAWLARAAAGRPICVLRSVVRSRHGSIVRPLGTVASGARANRALAACAWVLERWAEAIAPRAMLLAAPRASCAGVERAIEAVERALEQERSPLYVRKQIVHNAHVVGELEARGAVFVDEVGEAPERARLVFSAHGVAPAVRAAAAARAQRVVDATCPLVAKVHAEARRFARAGYTIVLIGHAGHEEIEGTLGEAPDRIRLIDSVGAVERLAVDDPERVAYLTQTTLAVDETRAIVDALRRRYPKLVGPRSDDICYATQNRQDAVRELASCCDVMVVVGSSNSSNSMRLVEVARRSGCEAHLIEDETAIEPAWLVGASTIGLSAGASAPESLVRRVTRALGGLGPLAVEERVLTREAVRFKLPRGLR